MQVDGVDMYGKGMAHVVPILLGIAFPLASLQPTLVYSFCRFLIFILTYGLMRTAGAESTEVKMSFAKPRYACADVIRRIRHIK